MKSTRKILSLMLSLALVCVTPIHGFATSIPPSESQAEIVERLREHVIKYHSDLAPEEQEDLVLELYEEKYVVPAQRKTPLPPDDTSENEAYDRMMAEETYIVDLINSMSDHKTTLEDWKYNLSFLQEHYDEIMALPDVNTWFVDDYIAGYVVVLKNEGRPDEQINHSSTKSSYNASDAKDYALKYYKNYNSDYPDWTNEGGDCANFVSQCLHAGGNPMRGTSGSSSEAEDWSNWFSSGTTRNVKKVSSTWRGAAAFRGY